MTVTQEVRQFAAKKIADVQSISCGLPVKRIDLISFPCLSVRRGAEGPP